MSNTVKLPTCPKCGIPIPKEAPQGLCPKCVLLGAATATEQGVPATATSEIPSIERISKAFPQLEILELIGRGGMGFVFKARQPHLDRFVALKLLPDKLAKDAQFAERFNREGRVLAKLNHPNIVSVFDFGQTGGFYYLTMEYVDGVNLRQAMRAGRFSPAEALSIVPKVCEALQYAHEQGILHRDIKPENILLDAKGRVKIADFGIAKLVGEDQPNITLTNTGAALGTPHYMAPEQLEKPATVDHRADIYSLGVVFYEMLTGELPIGRFAAPSAKTPVNTTVDDVVFRTLEKDRERRFQSAGEMRTQVEHLGAGSIEQPEAEDDADDDAPRSWLEAVYSMRLACWFFTALCLLDFAFPHVTRLGSSPANTYSLGLSRPWLVNVPLVDAHNVVTREWRFNPSTTSFGTGMLGLALVAVLLVLRHRVRTAPAVPRSASRISKLSLYGAISVGLSLPAPMRTLVALLTGMGGVGPGELWFALGSVALPGLGGTLLGWLALNEIRESRGRVKGLPLAMFATLFWPLTILGAVTIGVPMFLIVPGGEPGAARTFGRFLVLLLPAAVIAFSFWTIHSTARWASQQQVAPQRGLLKWVFIVVLLIGMGVVMVTNSNQRRAALQPPQPIVGGLPAEAIESPAPLRANFRFAKGHVVTFEVMRRVGENDYVPVPHFGGYAVAPDDERGRFSIMLTPDPMKNSTDPRKWTIRLVSETGGSAVGSSAALGELISMLPTNHWHQIEPDASFGLYLTRAYPGADTNGIVPLAELSLAVRSEARGKTGIGPESTALNLGSTNWVPSLKQLAKARPERRAQPGEVLASQWLKSPVGTNTTNWIRFTFTNVELRNENGQQWLAMGYITDVRGDCEEVFVVDATGFEAVTRKTGWRTTPAGSPPVEYSGIQWLVPPGIDAATLESFRDSVAEALVAKSFVIPEGEQRPLIRFPVGKVGILSVGIGAKLKLNKITGRTDNDLEVPRPIQFAGPDQHGLYLFLHTDSELRNGDYLVTQLKHPDGRVDETPAGNYAIRQNGKAVTTKSFSWPMAQFESNRVTEVAARIREALDGTVVSIRPRTPLEIFTATNDRGGVIEGSIELKTETSDKDGVILSVLSTHTWPQMLIAYLKVSGSFGYPLQGVGVYGNGVEVDTHTPINRDGAGNSSCRWNLPPGFGKAEADDIARQLEVIKNSAPNGLRIAPGQRVPVFALTNQAGTEFRGYLELPMTTWPEPAVVKTNSKKFFEAAATRQIEINRLRQSGHNLWLTTDSKFPLGDCAVGLLKRADGRIEEQLPSSYAVRRNGKVAITTSLYWSMASFESNRIAEIINSLGTMHDGRVVTLSAFQPLPLFTATNDRGGVISGSIELRTGSSVSGDAPATSLAIISTHAWPTMLSADFRTIGPLGHVPYGVGVYGDGAEVETTTVIYRHSASRSGCSWNLPPRFSKPEAEAIARQIETLKDSAPNGLRIRPGERVPVFAVTNQAGTIFRGFFELPPLNVTK